MGDPSIQNMDPGYAVFYRIDTVVQLRQHTSADIAVFDKLPGLLHMQLGNQSGRIFRIPAHALDVRQESQLLRVDRPGNGAGRVIRVDIVGVKILIQTHRTHNRQKILFQQIVENLGLSPP